MDWKPTRRRLLQGSALVTLGSMAGCLSAATSGQEKLQNGAGANSTSETTTSGKHTETTTDNCVDDETHIEATELSEPDSLDEWLSDANKYDGKSRRYGPDERVAVSVGKPTDDGPAFDPPLIEVPPMTDVWWEWTGRGEHNVVALDGAFDSGRTNAQRGTSYHHFFDEPGEYLFVSEPHYNDGMKGAVVVTDPPSTGYEAVDEWMINTSNFDGTVTDETGSETASIRVGTPGNSGNFAFDPPVLKVSTGTTITWEWTGNGGGHNVVFQEADIDSGEIATDSGETFKQTFETTGTYRYACEPHKGIAMKGALIVE
ncbi:halocyanin domain-containing protein [Haloferax larsenii]|uniref:Halocyanin domain-containing protein n=1 Tax=Haloferax larsenii TaxID=302484 RepID=A0ABY5REL7_HALLR|nr:halocyanin domain-containing protein [Haloferax larsenii]UVE49473.1 halocyanin domain-containing protein [Haloferax larsenii]